MTKAKKPPRMAPPVDVVDAHALVTNLDYIIANFKGDMHELESALGMYMVGRLMGWKVLVLIHNKRTIRKYEEILGIDIRKDLLADTPLSDKSVAYSIVQNVGNFWKAVSGELKDDELKERRSELAL